MREAKTGVVVVQDIEGKTMEKLLEFIYTGKIEEIDNQLERLLYAADKYEVQDLVGFELVLLSPSGDLGIGLV